MSDDYRILRIESETFADESFNDKHGPPGLLVLGQLPNWSELRWYAELRSKCGPELRWSKVRHRWPDLSADLRRAVVRDLREALITVIDPSIYRLDLLKSIESKVRIPKDSWPRSFQEFVGGQLDQYERQRILWDSPAVAIQNYLEDDGEILGGIGGIDGNTDDSRSLIAELDAKLVSGPSIRFFGARSAAAFAHLIDREGWADVIDAARSEGRFFTREYLMGVVLARGERIAHTFDDGNRPSVSAIVDIKSAIRERLARAGRIIIPDGMHVGAVEGSSKQSSILQAADLVGGYAKDLYLHHGLKAVCEEFKAVIFNGSMVRDWTQVARSDLTELRK